MTSTSNPTPRGLPRTAIVPLLVLAMAGVITALAAVRVGAYPLGTAYEDDASCLTASALPAHIQVRQDGPIPASAEHTWFPLGLVCTIEPLDMSGRTIVIPHQNWQATWIALAGLLTTAGALATTARIVTCRNLNHLDGRNARPRDTQ